MNASRVILSLDIGESHSLYIYIFAVYVSEHSDTKELLIVA